MLRNRLNASLAATIAGLMFVWMLFASTQVTVLPQAPTQVMGKVPTLAPVLRQITPAVVNISAQGHVREDNPLYRDPFFRRFMKPEQVEREFKSTGSGVIIDAENRYVLTSNHVIDNASAIEVTTKDNKSFRAEVIGQNRDGDLALLRLDGSEPLTAIALGDSGSLQVGDFVVAIGNPFGLGQTATLGIVSATGRGGVDLGLGNDLIQTDASINPGNSGGPLVDLNGRLIGINTAILASNGGNIGIGFAIPINAARNFIATQHASVAQHARHVGAFLPLPAKANAVRASLRPLTLQQKPEF